MVAPKFTIPATGKTLPAPVASHVQVVASQFVASLAVSLCLSKRDTTGKTPTTADVLKVRHRFEVIGIDTSAHATQVVEGQPVWDRTNHLLICEPMGFNAAAVQVERSITATAGQSADPQPTFLIATNIHLGPKPLHLPHGTT